MDLHIALVCFPVIFLGELPDKTMFANLIMATRGRPVQVWLGAAAAFTVHVAIAVSVGVALFTVLPRRYVAVVVAALFLLGAAYAWREGIRPPPQQQQKKAEEEQEAEEEEQQEEAEEREEEAAAAVARPGSSRRRVGLTAFAVIFLAEWGDLTQILTANLATRYHSAWPVAAGSLLALWAVAALAVASGQTLLRFLSIQVIRKITAVVLVGLAAYTVWSALQ